MGLFSSKNRSDSNTSGQVTGFDLLMAVASRAADQGELPYADQYVTLLDGFAGPDEHVMFGHQAVARSELRPHEVVPSGAVSLAARMALEMQDLESLKEVGVIGARLATVWPRFLLSTTAGHPELRARTDSASALQDASQDAEDVIDDLLTEGRCTDGRSFVAELRRRGLVMTFAPAPDHT